MYVGAQRPSAAYGPAGYAIAAHAAATDAEGGPRGGYMYTCTGELMPVVRRPAEV